MKTFKIKILFVIICISSILSTVFAQKMLEIDERLNQEYQRNIEIMANQQTSIELLSDDGVKIMLIPSNKQKEANNYATSEKRYPDNLLIYNIYCLTKKHILGEVNIPKNYLAKEHDWDYTFEKVQDFKNVSYYRLYMIMYDIQDPFKLQYKTPPASAMIRNFLGEDNIDKSFYAYEQENHFWIDGKTDLHCGCLLNFTISDGENIISMQQQYDALNDTLVYIATDGLKTNQGKRLINDSPLNKLIEYITFFDKENGVSLTELKNSMEEHREQYYSILAAKNATKNLLFSYTRPVSEILIRLDKENNLPHPNIAGELPTNEDELKIYLSWLLNALNVAGNEYESFYDSYGTEVIFEITAFGIRLISAGYDKEFGTEDDIVGLSQYNGKWSDNL